MLADDRRRGGPETDSADAAARAAGRSKGAVEQIRKATDRRRSEQNGVRVAIAAPMRAVFVYGVIWIFGRKRDRKM